MAQQITKDERSLGELFSELAGETSTLVRQEVALAQNELTQKAVTAGKNVGFLAAGGAVGYIGLMAIVAAIIIGLAELIGYRYLWLVALVVGIVIGIIAFFLISSALASLKKMSLTPNQTVESIKEDAEWLKKQM